MIFPGSENNASNPMDLWIPPKSNFIDIVRTVFPTGSRVYVFVMFIDCDYGYHFTMVGFWNEDTVIFRDLQTKKPW